MTPNRWQIADGRSHWPQGPPAIRDLRSAICLALLLFFTIAGTGNGQPATGNRPPSLIVVISVDQMRYDYLERFAPWFSTGGFNRFLKSGATFPNTHYLHAVTFTGPGHATIGSGRNPSEHGIIGNNWFERDSAVNTKQWDWYFNDQGGYETPVKAPPDPAQPMWYEAATGSPRYCVYDDSVTVTAGKTSGMSPRSLIGEGLGDRVKAKYPGAHVIGIALKDRAAILMAGRNADAAYWFDPSLPGFLSSTYYHFDRKLFSFNTTVTGYIPASHQWTASSYIPAADLKRVTFDPPEAWPLKNTRLNGTFPHPIDSIRSLVYTPYGNDLALDFASYAISAESLGTHSGTPDVLFVSLSSTDYFGHYYGPDSMEAADGIVRLDRSLEKFLDMLDRRFSDRVVVALTADHGVQSTPEILKLRDPNADAGRIDLRNPSKQGQRMSDLSPLRLEIEKQLAIRLHVPFSADAPYSHALVFFFEEPALFLNDARLRALKLDRERVKLALRNVILGLPGVDEAWTDTELRNAKKPSEPEKRMLRSYLQGRSGDVLIALKTNWIWTWGSNSTTHGQPVENDTHVPLLFWGVGVKSGRYDLAASPLDLAKTLGTIAGVEAGGAEAQVLPCLLSVAPAFSAAQNEVLQLAMHEIDPDNKIPREDTRIDKLEVNGNRANVTIWTGKPPKPRPGELSMDCGVGHTYVFERQNGQWVIVSRGVMQC